MSKTITSRLRRERELRGWTLDQVAERIGSNRVNVGRWEKGQTVPGPYYRQKLGELFNKSIQELGLVPESPDTLNIWSVPYRRNPFFTGRDEILTHLYTVLRSNRTAALTQAQAINGLGGIGKTQIALEYAYRYRDDYQAIFWVNASTRETLNTDFAALVGTLGLLEQDERDQDIILQVIKYWLASHARWLLVLDNVDLPEMITDFLPAHVQGDVLITTRQRALGIIAQGIEVEKMRLDESVNFLLHRSRVLLSSSSLNQIEEENKARAAEVFTALDGLPLALDQAGAYIEETGCGLSQYLDLFATRRKDLLLRRGKYPIEHPDSVAATWSLSFQQVGQENQAAVDLLNLCAFLDPESIPEEVITLGAEELGDTLATVASDPLQINAIIGLLRRYSLIRRNSQARSLSIHRLVQAVLKDNLGEEAKRMWVERAISAVNKAFPDVKPLLEVEDQMRERSQRLLSHAHMCAINSKEYALASPDAVNLFNKAATFLVEHSRYAEAEPLLLRVWEIRQDILGANHPDIARALNELGEVYRKRNKHQEAEPFLQKALEIRQQVLGEEHLDVAETLYNLANLYRDWGKYEAAEPFYLRSLHIRQALSDANDPLVAVSYFGLAKLYNSQKKYEQAERFCRSALDIQEQHLRREHPALASTLNILAKIYLGQNKLDLAKTVNLRALQIREKASGADDFRVATIANNLAEIYHVEGKHVEAEPWIERAIRIHEQTLGWEHPYMAYSLNNLAENYFLKGDFSQAETYYKLALDIRKRQLGSNHSHTIFSYSQLARLYRKQNREGEADELEAHIQTINARQSTNESP